MDIVTHAMIGVAVAAPAFLDSPLAAAGFVIGSVLPDIDAVARVFGKKAFLRWHQTYSHSIPVIFSLGLLLHAVLLATFPVDRFAALALVAGMLLHVALDISNTYGTAVLSPFSRRRFAVDWMFFIDLPAILGTASVLAAQGALGPSWRITIGYGIVGLAYVLARAILRRRAWNVAPAATKTLIPSALLPWSFLGLRRTAGTLTPFQINAATGRVIEETPLPDCDDQFAGLVRSIPEYQLMQELTPAYHITSVQPAADGTVIHIRDLRTRNFGGRFGELELTISPDGQIQKKVFHV